MSMSLIIEFEEELETMRDEVYGQLEKLLRNPLKFLSTAIKTALRNHLDDFNFGYEWVDDAQELIFQAKAEHFREADLAQDYLQLDESWIDDSTNKFWELVEYWEKKTKPRKTKKKILRGLPGKNNFGTPNKIEQKMFNAELKTCVEDGHRQRQLRDWT